MSALRYLTQICEKSCWRWQDSNLRPIDYEDAEESGWTLLRDRFVARFSNRTPNFVFGCSVNTPELSNRVVLEFKHVIRLGDATKISWKAHGISKADCPCRHSLGLEICRRDVTMVIEWLGRAAILVNRRVLFEA